MSKGFVAKKGEHGRKKGKLRKGDEREHGGEKDDTRIDSSDHLFMHAGGEKKSSMRSKEDASAIAHPAIIGLLVR